MTEATAPNVGRDYTAGYSNSYEYVLFNAAEKVVARMGGFKSVAAARRAALKAIAA